MSIVAHYGTRLEGMSMDEAIDLQDRMARLGHKVLFYYWGEPEPWTCAHCGARQDGEFAFCAQCRKNKQSRKEC